MKEKITKKMVDALPYRAPQYIVFDTELSGFGIRVGKKEKVYIVQRRLPGSRRVIKYTIGRHGDPFTPESARKVATEIILKIRSGEDPNATKKSNAREANIHRSLTLDELLTRYVDGRLREINKNNESEINKNTANDLKRVRNRLSHWLAKPAGDITRAMVLEEFKKQAVEHETTTNLIFRYLRAVFKHHNFLAEGNNSGLPILDNPTVIITKEKLWQKAEDHQRKDSINTYKGHDLAKWWKAVESYRHINSTISDYLIFTLLAGGRSTETGTLLWSNVDWKKRIVTFEKTKNGKTYEVPISRFAFGILKRRFKERKSDQEYVFPAKHQNGVRYKKGHLSIPPTKAIYAIEKQSNVSFRMHDLKRTFGTTLNLIGVGDIDKRRLLKHSLRGDVSALYVGEIMDKQRAHLQNYENYILKKANVKK